MPLTRWLRHSRRTSYQLFEAPRRPLVIGHRGASAYAPENTLAAIALAQQQGADMVEIDVRKTADDELVVFHDATTERWTAESARPVQSYTFEELRHIKLTGELIPSLEEVLDLARSIHIRLNVEIKDVAIETRVADMLRAYDLADQTLISSFYDSVLHTLARYAPEVGRAYLMGVRTYRPNVRLRELLPLRHLHSVGAHAWHPYHALPFVRRIIASVRRAGYMVNAWTVDDPVRMRLLCAWGVSGLITNTPDVARRIVDELHSAE